jgi:hypothetical protein
VERELLTFPEHPSSSLVFSSVHVARFLVFRVLFCRRFVCPFVSICKTNVLTVLRFTDSECTVDIFKCFLYMTFTCNLNRYFVFLSLFCWSVYCLSFDLLLLLTPSNFSIAIQYSIAIMFISIVFD